MNKLLVILGPTATGKSDLAVEIAKKYNGEVISADSRQVYKGLDIGSGKITKKEMLGVKHYMLDIISPKSVFSVAQFKKKTEKIITDIHKRGKLPILCGGTGFYISTVVDGLIFPEVKANNVLRNKLEKQTTEKLLETLKKLDPERAENIDIKNRVRLIRAIEISKELGSIPKVKKDLKYNVLEIGLDWQDEILRKRIHDRLLKRMKTGMLKEVENLHKIEKVSWKRLESLGLEYRYLALFIQNKIGRKETLEELETKIWQFAKRQRTWFKRDDRIKWFNPKDINKIEKEVKRFI